MRSALAILALAAAAAQAAPVEERSTSHFSAPAVHNPNHVRNGTAALLKAYAKHHINPTREMPESFMSALKKRQDGSVTAVPYEDAEYLVETTVGGQKLNLDFDTGSADLWVFSSLLPSSEQSGHSIFTSSKSSTFKSLSGYTWKISYGDGSSASGSVGTDTVTIGSTTVKGQCVELAKKVSSEFVQDGSDGLVGLAFSNINTVSPQQQSVFWENAADSLDSPLFAAYLPFNADGAYDFGATDDSKYTGSLTYVDVSSDNGFWEYPSTSYKVGSTTHSQSGWTAITDTGTTLMLMGDSAVDNYYAQVSGAKYSSSAGGYTFSCSASLPNLSVKIGSGYAVVPGSVINYGPISSGSKTCFGGLQSIGDGQQAIYGDVFLNANYGVFDFSVPRFGYAPLSS